MNFSCVLPTYKWSYNFSWRETTFQSLKAFWASQESKRNLKRDLACEEGHSPLADSKQVFGETFIACRKRKCTRVKNLTFTTTQLLRRLSHNSSLRANTVCHFHYSAPTTDYCTWHREHVQSIFNWLILPL